MSTRSILTNFQNFFYQLYIVQVHILQITNYLFNIYCAILLTRNDVNMLDVFYLGNCRIFLTWNNSIPQSSSISIFFLAILMKLCHEVTKTNLEGADFMEGFCNLICSLLDWNSNRQFSCIFLPAYFIKDSQAQNGPEC